MKISRFLASAALCLALAGTVPASAAPTISLVKDGMQDIPFVSKPNAAAVLEDYPFLGPVIDQVGGHDEQSTRGRMIWTALVKDRDLKANFLFVYVEGIEKCSLGGCPLFALVNEGEGFTGFTSLRTRPPAQLLKKKDGSLSLILHSGTKKTEWPFADHAFRHGQHYMPEMFLSPVDTKDLPVPPPPGQEN